MLAGTFAVAGVFAVLALRAADAKDTKEKKAKEPVVTEAVIKKYDANKTANSTPTRRRRGKPTSSRPRKKEGREKS